MGREGARTCSRSLLITPIWRGARSLGNRHIREGVDHDAATATQELVKGTIHTLLILSLRCLGARNGSLRSSNRALVRVTLDHQTFLEPLLIFYNLLSEFLYGCRAEVVPQHEP